MSEDNKSIVFELIERLNNVDNEIKLLQDDRKSLLEEYKDKLDIKAFKAALSIAKIRSRLGDSEEALDNMLDKVLDKICD